MIELELLGGEHISNVSKRACQQAAKANDDVRFTFNDTAVTVHPGEKPADVEARWHKDYEAAAEAYRNSDEYKEAVRKREEEEHRKATCSMKESAQTEAELRDAKVPWPYTMAQLTEYIQSLTERQHDYGTCVYAMSMAAEAAFNFMSHQLGVTGFQASCADLDFIRRSRSIKGPFILLNGEDLLYPQCDLREKLDEAIKKWQPWAKEEAEKKLAENPENVAESVAAHWKKLARAT